MDYDWTVRTTKVPAGGHNEVVTETYVLRGHGLPAGYNYRIHVTKDGDIFSRSCPGSGGGVRYYSFGNESDAKNLWRAMDHGMKWAKRHQSLVARNVRRTF